MSERSFISKIITEALYNNPEVSPNEILEGIVNLMENDILPAVFKGLSSPKFPSAIALLKESRGRRLKKRFRTETTLDEKRALIQQFELIKLQLARYRYRDNSSLEPIIDFSDSDNFIKPSGLSKSSIDKKLEYNGEPIRAPTIEPTNNPYSGIPLFPKVEHQIVLSEEIQDKIVSDPLFEKIFKSIETEIRELAFSYPFEILDISIHSDFEIPDWKRTVLTLTVPPMSFEEQMKLWQRFDFRIRKRIAETIKHMDESDRKRVEVLNKNLFIHMDLT